MNLIIIAITAIVSYLALQNRAILEQFMLSPYENFHSKKWYTMVTAGFLHADYGHLLFNMFTLYFFGQFCLDLFTETYGEMGMFFYLGFYVVAIVIANIPASIKHKNHPWYRALGASGAVSAVLFSFIVAEPWQLIYIYFIPVPAIIFGVLYLVYTTYMAKKGKDNIGHDAHFAGAVFGVLSILVLFPAVREGFFDKLLNFPF